MTAALNMSVSASSSSPMPTPTTSTNESPRTQQIIDGVRFAPKTKGWAAYGGGDSKSRLQDINRRGLISMSPNEIEMFRLLSIPESGGLVNAINSWDSAYMSMGFMQFTIQHYKLQEVIKRAPDRFRKYGIEIDYGRYLS